MASEALRIGPAREQDAKQHQRPGTDQQPRGMAPGGIGDERDRNYDSEWRSRDLPAEKLEPLSPQVRSPLGVRGVDRS